MAGSLLFNGDRRRQALDQIHIRLVHQLQKLAGVSGEALDVAALTLGVKRVKGERRFPRPRKPGHDDQPMTRQIERHVL